MSGVRAHSTCGDSSWEAASCRGGSAGAALVTRAHGQPSVGGGAAPAAAQHWVEARWRLVSSRGWPLLAPHMSDVRPTSTQRESRVQHPCG